MLFAHLKRILRLDRLRLRGRAGQMSSPIGGHRQNLRKLASSSRSRAPILAMRRKSSKSADLIVVPTAIRSCRPGFFNTIPHIPVIPAGLVKKTFLAGHATSGPTPATPQH